MQKINIDKQTGLFFILAAVLFLELLVVFPWEIKKISDLTKQTAKIAQSVVAIENEWPRKGRYLANKEQLKEKIKRIQERFILKQQESRILSFISVSSENSKVKIQSLVPGELQEYTSTKWGEFKYLPVVVKAECKFHDLALFLNSLNDSQYFFEVKKLDILPTPLYNSIEMIICAAIAV
ncbi:MAG: hypothetical protein HQ570_01625, partial [Candidatus Omnitrophica bacterium]|nr:hypothetical protein [Candidatus Omnitrophota bacterium]